MQKFIIISILFHISLLAIVQLDLIEIKSEKKQVISIGVLEESPPPIKKEPKKVVKKEPKKVVKKEPKKVVKKEPKKVVKKEPKKVVKKEPKKVVKKEPKKVVKKEPKKVIKKESKKNEKFDDLLKNLASEDLKDEIKKSSIDNKIKELSNNSLLEKPREEKKEKKNLIYNIIQDAINDEWKRPPGIKIVKNLNTKLIIKLDSDGNVIKVVLHKQTQADILNNSTLQPYLDSALRAVKKASPIEGLPKDSYSIWREIVINFKPEETR